MPITDLNPNLKMITDAQVGDELIFRNQYQAARKHPRWHVFTHGKGDGETVTVIRVGEADPPSYRVEAHDGCTFWAAPWELRRLRL